ncbi:PHD finger protein 21A-like isoform X2 [Mya arenaria]|uniref:PHD finger protein 21A-like isoform X2 n=1 Tax=Mya arenaria TaxID=6604 RepID=UPI0022E8A50D|nr:PHD finger protein 21A-like isoform X2 [Mya arenaria]
MNMSNLALNKIQSDLKIAIQTHQILVAKMQIKPLDADLKTRLRGIQREILAMSQKQKLIVQKLRKDLMEGPSALLEENGQKETKCCGLMGDAINSEPRSPVCVKALSPLRVPQYTATCQKVTASESKLKVTISNLEKTPEKPYRNGKTSRGVSSIERARELKKKLDFMQSLDLIPPDSIKDSTGKRSERKRKSTHNPNFAYGFELERKPRLSTFLATDYFGVQKPRGLSIGVPPSRPRCASSSSSEKSSSPPPSPSDTTQQNHASEKQAEERVCQSCGESGLVVPCDSCSQDCHAHCLTPPITATPTSRGKCHACQEAVDKVSKSLLAVNTYISNKTSKEEEKRRLLKRSMELLQEKANLETRTTQLNELLARQGFRKQELIDVNMKAKQSVEKLKNFVKVVQSA